MYIGKISSGANVMISKESPNQHLIISGISGVGKSVRIIDIERCIIEAGGTVIAFDMNGTHSNVEGGRFNYISAQEDGLDVKFLDTAFVESGKETLTNLVQYVIETLCPRQLRGACQLATVRKAIQFAIKNKQDFSCEMDAIAYGLKEQDDAASMGAYNHLCPILEGKIFRKSRKRIVSDRVNVISLKGLNPKTQKRVLEIMLAVLWKKLRSEGVCKNGFTLILDEFQNLDFDKETAFFQMLTEARKYGVNMILATQTLSIFSRKELAIINQAAVKLYFQQSVSDVKTVSGMIDLKHREKWISELSQLKVGQAITVGAFEINGRQIRQPIITYSDYDEATKLICSKPKKVGEAY